jgi:hypothetical protein
VNATYRQIARHAGIFGAGAILSRLASIVLLPLYTRHLRPTDYGIMALLDVTINVLAIMAGAGIGSAATRAHFADNEHVDASRVWWTAILCETAIAGMIVMPALALRARIATVVFGPSLTDGPSYVALALTTLWVTSITTIVDSYFRARKASAFIVGVGLGRLLINVALNVLFLVWYRMGVAGVLWGNLISAVVAGVIECAPFLDVDHAADIGGARAVVLAADDPPLVVDDERPPAEGVDRRGLLRKEVVRPHVGRDDVHVVVERTGPALDLEVLVAGRGVRVGRAIHDLNARPTVPRPLHRRLAAVNVVRHRPPGWHRHRRCGDNLLRRSHHQAVGVEMWISHRPRHRAARLG